MTLKEQAVKEKADSLTESFGSYAIKHVEYVIKLLRSIPSINDREYYDLVDFYTDIANELVRRVYLNQSTTSTSIKNT
jgi:hypothetical protein